MPRQGTRRGARVEESNRCETVSVTADASLGLASPCAAAREPGAGRSEAQRFPGAPIGTGACVG
eukprot:3859214-Prymnesium_polylepis.3